MTRRHILLLFSLLMSLPVLSGCPSPAAPPAPPAEIPGFLTIPRDLSISVEEVTGSSTSPGLKLQIPAAKDVRTAIDLSATAIEESNLFLDIALTPASQTDIPVSASITTFENVVPLKEGDPSTEFGFKFDFGRFDLDGDGALEDCTGCTCPVGCAPDLAVCPTEASEADLHPICIRIWLSGVRFLAGLFDRVPTKENPQSGQLRIALPTFSDLGGSPFGIFYDHRDPNDRLTDLSAFFMDDDVGKGSEFFSRTHMLGHVEGPEGAAKKTAKLTSEFLAPPSAIPGILQFQGRYLSNLDFISLEVLTDGVYSDDPEVGAFGIPDITPPICAQITTANPVADILCTDLGLTVTAGEFLTLPALEDVQLPPFSEFPESAPF